MASKPFNQRLKDAIASGSSAIVATMIREAEETSAAASKAADEAKARALDPLLDDAEITAARKAAEDATFTMERMVQAARVLQAKREEFREAEDQANLRKVYDATLARREAIAERVRKEYPALANQLGSIVAEIVATDEAIRRINKRLPHDAETIGQYVEECARPVADGHAAREINGHRIAECVSHLPSLEIGGTSIWGRTALVGNVRVHAFTPETPASETPNAEEARSNAKAASKAGEAPASGGQTSPVSNLKEEAA